MLVDHTADYFRWFTLPRLLSDVKWRGENFWSRVQFGDDLQSRCRDHLRACTAGSHRLSRLYAFASSVDWLIGLSSSFMIDRRDVICLVLQRSIENRSKFFLCRRTLLITNTRAFLNLVTKNTFTGNITVPLEESNQLLSVVLPEYTS